MPNPHDGIHLKSGGGRLALYAELGRYFHPDGSLNEPAFREFLRASLKTQPAAQEESSDGAGAWLSAYLEDVLAYLDEKGMAPASARLLEVAIDESAKLGITRITVSPVRMRHLLSAPASGHDAGASWRRAPDEKKRKIFDCALDIITQRGFHEVTMDEIAAAAGVAKGTIYRYFKSKEDLLDQLLLATGQTIAERFSTVFTGEKNILDEIRQFVEEWVHFVEENHVLYRLIQAEGITPHSGHRGVFYEYLIANFPMAKERVASLNAGGELKTVNFHTVAYGLLGFIDGVVNKWFRSGMDYPLSDEIPTIIEVLLHGFARERHPVETLVTESRN